MKALVPARAVLAALACTVAMGATAQTLQPRQTVAAGNNPTSMAIDPVTRRLYVTNHDNDTVSVFKLNFIDAQPLATIPVGHQPNHVAVNTETDAVYVSNEGDGTMTVIDARTNQVRSTSTINVGGAMAVNPVTNRMFMLRASPKDEFNVIVGDTFQQSDAIRSYQPITLAMNPVTNRLFIGTEATSDVVAHNMNTESDYPLRECPDGSGGLLPDSGPSNPDPPACIDVPGYPVSVAVNPVNNRTYALTSTGQVSMIQGPNMTFTTATLTGNYAPVLSPVAIAVNPVTNVVIALFQGNVVLLDGDSLQPFYSATTTGPATALAVDVIHDLVAVATSGGTVQWLRGSLRATGGGSANVPADTRAVVFDPVQYCFYVLSPQGVTTVAESGFLQAVVPSPITVKIAGFTNQSADKTSGTVTLTASSSMSPSPLDQVRAVWVGFAKDGTPFAPARPGPNGTWVYDFSGLKPGTSYPVVAFATNGLDMAVTHADRVQLPLASAPDQVAYTTASSAPVKLVHRVRHYDFDRDGRNDLLWYNAIGNQNAMWLMNGAQIKAGVVLPYPTLQSGGSYSDSRVIGAGDADADGKTDLFWWSVSKGEGMFDTLMDGTTERATGAYMDTLSRFPFTTGDFNGDGKKDLLMYSGPRGGYYIQLIDGTSYGAQTTTDNIRAGGSVAAVADFDGDGKDDVLFVDPDGSVWLCLVNGVNCSSTTMIRPAGNTFVPVAIGDFNGDGRTDIVWQSSDGTTSLWLMNGATTIDSGSILGAGTGWRVVGAPDMNGDGRSDLVFEKSDGSYAGWLMNGTSAIAYRSWFGGGSGWRYKLATDLDGDGKDDIVWRNDDGRYAPWLMNGLDATGYGSFFGPNTGWEAFDD